MAKTIDITPTWSQWLNLVMAIALRGKDPAKVLEPLSEDFKKMARAADGYNAIPSDTIDILQDTIDSIDHLKDDPQIAETLDKLIGLRSTLLEIVEEVQ